MVLLVVLGFGGSWILMVVTVFEWWRCRRLSCGGASVSCQVVIVVRCCSW
jgi:hypothetical protein